MKNILVVIDMQNGFVRDIDSAMLDRVRHLTTSNIFDAVIATRFVNEPDSSFVNILGWDKMMSGDELKLIDGLVYNVIFEKCTYSCVTDNFVDVCCRLNDCEMPTRLFLCGVDTDSCVLATAIDLFDHGIRPMLLPLLCFIR